MSNNTIEAAKQAINELHQIIGFLHGAITRSGMDLSPCKGCGQLVVCVPDGLACCKPCAEKMGGK
jgi:hypothetical protein